MADLVKWKPFHSLMRGFFDDFSPLTGNRYPLFREDLDFIPKMDIKETEKELVVTMDVPGIEKKELNVSVEKGILTIKGEKKGEKREERNGYTYYERQMGTFERRVRLPENSDEAKVKAEYKDGVLSLTVPKHKVEKPEQKKIEIT